jgi:hypothetical protein
MGLHVECPPFNMYEYPNRVDLSVNNAIVDNPFSESPFMHTWTGGNAVNGFNGGGLGSKSILGFDVGNGLPLGSLLDLQWTSTDFTPYITQPWPIPFGNLVIDLLGTNLLYVLAIIDPQSNPGLMPGSGVLNLDGSTTWSWNSILNAMLIVGSDVVSPSKPILIPPSFTVGAGFLNNSFTIAQILSIYPAAVLRRANNLDGGMPRIITTPAFMLVEGDSGSNRNINIKLGDVLFNGVNV